MIKEISPSGLQDLCKCPLYYRLHNIEGWQPKLTGEPSSSGFGKALHNVMEVYDKAKCFGEDALSQAVSEAWRQAKKYHLRRLDEIETLSVAGNIKTKMKACSMEALFRAVVWYDEQFKSDTLKTYMLDDFIPAVEVKFSGIVIPGTNYKLNGRIDRIVQDDNGAVYLLDRKTTSSSVTNKYFEQFEHPNLQINCYLWVARNILKIPVSGFIIEAYQLYVNSVEVFRHETNRSPEQINEALKDIQTWLELKDHCDAVGDYPMNPSSCGMYGGCEMRAVCARAPAMRQALLEADYERRYPDEPMDYYFGDENGQ